MRHKKQKGFYFLMISLIFFMVQFNFNLTGNVVGFNASFSYFRIIGIVTFLISILIFASRQTLDAIMIPTGQEENERVDRAYEEGKKNEDQIYLISGKIDKPTKSSEVYKIYKRLRGYGIKPKDIKLEAKSKNTLENVLLSLEKLKKMGAHDIGIASYPKHLDRFEDLIEEAKKEGIIDKNFKVHRLETPESFEQWFYGILHRAVYRYELAHGGIKSVGKSKLRLGKKN